MDNLNISSSKPAYLSMEESSHEQLNSPELEFMALMLDSAPALEHTLITPNCTLVLRGKRVPTPEFSTQNAQFHCTLRIVHSNVLEKAM